MRKVAWLAIAALVAASGCKREPTFDERFEGAQKAITELSNELDADLATRASDSAQIDDASQPAVPTDSGV